MTTSKTSPLTAAAKKWLPQLMLQQMLCAAIEAIINKALTLNIHGVKGLNPLEQKTLAVKLDELGFVLCLSVNQQKVLVTKLQERADCTITTSIKTLQELKKQQQLTTLIKDNKLDITGDIKVAQHFAQIAETLDIDWQSEIADHIGDIATYKLGQLAKNMGKKTSFAVNQIQADASEYLVHEQRLVVTSSQINFFNQQVNEVSAVVDQLENRIKQLQQNKHFLSSVDK